MKKLTLVMVGCVFLMACSKPPIVIPTHTPLDLSHLKTVPLMLSTVEQEIPFDGVVEAINQATVSSQVAGRVVALPVDVGDVVKKGELIVQFTDVEQKARAASARAKWVEAQTQFMRMQDMLARKLIAKADFDKAEALYKSADAALKEAEEIAANTAVYAPYGGVVVSRSVKVGETVAPGTPLMTGLSLEHLRVQVDIPQRHIGAIRTFKTARITLANGLMVKTHDLRISPSADPLSHAFKILVNLPQGDYTQEPGTLVKVHFVSGSEEQLLIDAQAVAQRGEVNGVYTLAEQSIDFRLVRLGTRTKEGKYPVLAGLQAGERIAQDPVAAAAAYKKAHSRLVQ